jgi:hypothetical protein
MTQDQASDEVRTRRLVIVDDDGTDRIVAEVRRSIAEVRVALPDIDGHTGSVQIYAAEHDGKGELGPMLGVQAWADGNVRAGIDVWLEEGRWRSTVYSPDESS